MLYRGFYINLDRSEDRRLEIEREIVRQNLVPHYERFAAVEGNQMCFPNPNKLENGALGCFSSHLSLLEQHRDSPMPLHLIEDDVVFSPYTEQAINWAIKQGVLSEYDILYTDVALPIYSDVFTTYRGLFAQTVDYDDVGNLAKVSCRIFDLAPVLFSSTSSYVIRPESLGKVAALFRAELERGAVRPVDLFLRQLAQEGKIRIGCLMPFVTSVRLERTVKSCIESRGNEVSALAMDVARQTFFIGCDWAKCDQFLDQHFVVPQPVSRQTQVLTRILDFAVAYDDPLVKRQRG